MVPEAVKRPWPIGTRGAVLVSVGLAGLLSAVALGLSPADLVPTESGLRIAADFFSRAFTPALTYESETVPAGATPFLLKVLEGARRTFVFAMAAVSLSLVVGLILGFLGSTAWWEGDPAGRHRWARAIGPAIYGGTRVVISLMRSVHELLWATLFLAAFGFNTFAAVIAIAIPYSGTLAKIFSEMIDEADRGSSRALRAIGAHPIAVFTFGLLPRALPDMIAYTFYRSECAIRSAAVLGFFGYGTLGAYIKSSFDNLHYGEVWTYLYALFLLVAIVDGVSGLLRRRFVGYE
jgi:phosphonate transport system permease protein